MEICTYNQRQYSRTLLQISREKEKNKHDQETGIILMHIQWVRTYSDSGTNIQSQREREKYEARDVRIHAELIIIHIFSRALLHTDRAERAFWHTSKLPIIYPDTDKDRGIGRWTNTWNKRRTYIRTISDNIAEHRHKHDRKWER